MGFDPTEIPKHSDSESDVASPHQSTVELGLISAACRQQPASSQPASQRRRAQL
eukprot:COSAG01_NODE_46715_length_397_cov_1.748322_1_plen_53_part_10